MNEKERRVNNMEIYELVKETHEKVGNIEINVATLTQKMEACTATTNENHETLWGDPKDPLNSGIISELGDHKRKLRSIFKWLSALGTATGTVIVAFILRKFGIF